MDEFGPIDVDAGQNIDTGKERIRYGLSSWSNGGGSGVPGPGGMR